MGEIPHADLRRICHKLPSDGVNRPGIQDTARVVVLAREIRLGRRSSEIRRFGSEVRKRETPDIHPSTHRSTHRPTGHPEREAAGWAWAGLFSNGTSRVHDALKRRRNVAIGDHPELQGGLQVVRVVNIHPAGRRRGLILAEEMPTPRPSLQGDILYLWRSEQPGFSPPRTMPMVTVRALETLGIKAEGTATGVLRRAPQRIVRSFFHDTHPVRWQPPVPANRPRGRRHPTPEATAQAPNRAGAAGQPSSPHLELGISRDLTEAIQKLDPVETGQPQAWIVPAQPVIEEGSPG